MKKFEDWKTETITSFLKRGDKIDKKLYNHFLNVSFPITYSNGIFQVGGAYDYVNGKATYLTFSEKNGEYFYLGDCFKGAKIKCEKSSSLIHLI